MLKQSLDLEVGVLFFLRCSFSDAERRFSRKNSYLPDDKSDNINI